MRIHLLASPNTQTTAAYPLDGFCTRTMLFAALVKRLGHEVILYGVERNEAPCDTFVSCLSAADQTKYLDGVPYQNATFSATSPLFLAFNATAAMEIRHRKQAGDVIATITGQAQQQVSEYNPDLTFLEYSIGYKGVCAPVRVYQSHVWRHTMQACAGIDGGREFDAVIPPWFPADDFPYTSDPEPYVLYCGRLVINKGLKVACAAAEHAGVKLLVIGHGDPALVTYGEYLGAVSYEERNRLLSRARAVLMPTQYLEPFGNVSAEAQLCGTPVISTDYGAFVESVEQGVTGYRCHSLGEFVQAIDLASDLDRRAIRTRARRLYSTEAAETAYRPFFQRLSAFGTDGWWSLAPTLPASQLMTA